MAERDAIDGILAKVDASTVPMALVAIDGHSAAGKSTLARAMQARRTAVIVPTDDFYRPLDPDHRASLDAAGGYEWYYDWQRLEREVLRPLRSGSAARFRRYDPAGNELDDWSVVEPRGLVIVEGCYSARPELRPYYDAIALVVTPPGERLRRQRVRDDATDDWLERWDAAERYYLERFRPDLYADVLFSGL